MNSDIEDLDALVNAAIASIDFNSRKALTEGEKLCNGCNIVKSITEFNNRKDRGSSDKYGKVSKCRACTSAAAKDWYYKNHEQQKARGREQQYLRRHEGRITPAEAKTLATNNVGYCDLCTDYGVIYIDHDHVTEARRGFLCNRCNFALGGFRDDAKLLQKAAAYILRYKERQV